MSDGTQTKPPINLLRGWPNPSLLPVSEIQSAANAALSQSSVSTPGLLYGPDPGYQPLRESISKWLNDFYAPALSALDIQPPRQNGDERGPDAERICITGGASQNLACLLQVFADPVYTRVWMVAPCYFLACRIFQDVGLKIGAIREGEEGVDLEFLERRLMEAEKEMTGKKVKQPQPWSKIYRHVIYCVPTYSNPSGKTMSLSNRIELLNLARKYDALIISDDVYDVLQWPTSPSTSSTTSSTDSSSLTQALLPRLSDLDSTLEPVAGPESFGNVVSNGSFSKISGPGLRTGWAESTRKFTYGLSQCGSSRSGGAPSQFTAAIVNELLISSSLTNHIEKVLLPTYQKRYNLLMDAIKKDLVPLGVRVGEDSLKGKDVFGGFFIWIELPGNMDAELVTSRAQEEENLIVAPGKIFAVDGDESVTFPNEMRLCFSWEEEDNLDKGVKRLAKVVKGVMEGKQVTTEARVEKQDLGEFQ